MAAKRNGLGKGLDSLIPDKSDKIGKNVAKKSANAAKAPENEEESLKMKKEQGKLCLKLIR